MLEHARMQVFARNATYFMFGDQICEAIMLHGEENPERAEEIAAEMLDKPTGG